MSEIIGYTNVFCPDCKTDFFADVLECNCIFGKCPTCGLDYEDETKCFNNMED